MKGAGILCVVLAGLAIWCTLVGGDTETREGVAKVIGMKGSVEVKSDGTEEWEELRLGREVCRGDRIRTGRDSEGTLLFGDDTRVVVYARSVVTVREAGVEVIQGRSSTLEVIFKGLYEFLRGKSRDSIERFASVGGSRAMEEDAIHLVLLRPRSTKVLTGYPEFVWTPVPEISCYTITIMEGERTVWQEEGISETRVVYPRRATRLREGKTYCWTVAGEREDELTRSEEMCFEVLSSEDAQRIRRRIEGMGSLDAEDASTHFLLGNIYEKEGLYVDAEREYEEAIRLHPEDQMVRIFLGELYWQVGLEDRARKVFEEVRGEGREE